jgi:tetratricopeptide (TPR) repeat protein
LDFTRGWISIRPFYLALKGCIKGLLHQFLVIDNCGHQANAEKFFMHVSQHYTEYIKQAKTAEKQGDVKDAISLYENAIKQKPVVECPYTRLMIIYRKNKSYNDEMRVINKAIELFTDHYDKKRKKFKHSTKVNNLSKALLKTIGDERAVGENMYPQPIAKWLKRKKIVENKIGA